MGYYIYFTSYNTNIKINYFVIFHKLLIFYNNLILIYKNTKLKYYQKVNLKTLYILSKQILT